MTESITIIGAGIGGLTTALTLQQKGLRPVIYESAPEIRPVGAGIIMASNAMQVFRQLGIHEKIENAGYRVSQVKITDEKLRTLSAMDLSRYENTYGVHNVAIHRADLQKILAGEIGSDHIHLSKRLTHIREDETYTLTFKDGSTVHSEVVIGADGIRSVVREQLLGPGEIRDTGQRCWRGVVNMELPARYAHEANEAWGKGKRFGFVKINARQVYWYAVVNARLVKQNDMPLADLFREFHPDIIRIIAGTPEENLFFSDIIDLKPIYQWHRRNACLIGDAAHATTPNMGQGACQAVEDAYTIGKLLQPGKSMETVFAGYEKARIKKAHTIVNRSWKMGQMAHWENPVAAWFRNTLMKSIPSPVSEKQLGKVFDIGDI